VRNVRNIYTNTLLVQSELVINVMFTDTYRVSHLLPNPAFL